MDSNPNETQLFVSSVSGVPNPQSVALFKNRLAVHPQHPVALPLNFNSVTDSSIWPAANKRRSSTHVPEKSVDFATNGDTVTCDGDRPPSTSDGLKSNSIGSPAKRACLSNSPCQIPNANYAPLHLLPPSTTEASDSPNISVSTLKNIPITTEPKEVGDPTGLREGIISQVSTNPEPTRMSLEKLDATIDTVLDLARSDEPHEEIFVLNCRNRECPPIPSPLNQESTPNSSLNMSPSCSPSSSPKLFPIISPAFANSNVSSNSIFIATSHQFSKHMADKLERNVQLVPTPIDRDDSSPNISIKSEVHKDVFAGPNIPQSNSIHGNPVPASGVTMLLKPSPIETSQSTPLMRQQVLPTPNYFESPIVRCTSNTQIRASDTRTITSSVVNALPIQANMRKQSVNLSPRMVACIPQRPSCDQASFSVPSVVHQRPYTSDVINSKVHGHGEMPVSYGSQCPLTTMAHNIETNGVAYGVAGAKIKPSITPSNLQHGTDASLKTLSPAPKKRPSSRRKKSIPGPNSIPSSKMAVSNPISSCKSSINYSLGFTQSATQTKQSVVIQDILNELTLFDSKLFLSDPKVEPFVSALPPIAAPSVPLLSVYEEENWIKNCGFKYKRNGLAVRTLKPSSQNDENTNDRNDIYLAQRLPQLPSRPVMKSNPAQIGNASFRVCASPKPVSFENHLNSFFTKLRQPDCKNTPDELDNRKPADTPCLLPMLSTAPCLPSEISRDRCTPPLPLYHIPNTGLLKNKSPKKK